MLGGVVAGRCSVTASIAAAMRVQSAYARLIRHCSAFTLVLKQTATCSHLRSTRCTELPDIKVCQQFDTCSSFSSLSSLSELEIWPPLYTPGGLTFPGSITLLGTSSSWTKRQLCPFKRVQKTTRGYPLVTARRTCNTPRSPATRDHGDHFNAVRRARLIISLSQSNCLCLEHQNDTGIAA